MNRAELAEAVATGSGLTERAAEAVVDALLSAVTEELAAGGRVSVMGFGCFEVKRRPERLGRNPATNEPMRIPAGQVPVFRAGKKLRDALNEN